MATASDQVNPAPSTAERRLPDDCVILDIDRGGLLVSPAHATFCPIERAELAELSHVLGGQAPADELPERLLARLTRHGFFAAPRPAEPTRPTVQLQLTNECGLACVYCCTHSGHARADELRREEAFAVVRETREALGPDATVALLGGEPLGVPWAPELSREVLRLGLDLTLFTNGTLLADPALADAVAQLVRDGAQVRVSLAGPTAELCDRRSAGPRFEAAMAGIRALVERGTPPVVDLMLLPSDASAVAEHLPELRRAIGKHTPLALNLLYDSGREQGRHLFHDREELEAALDRIAFQGACAIPAAERAPLTYRREGCDCALGHHLHVRSDGALFSCFKMEEQVGELRGDGFLAALRQVRSQPQRAPELATCRGCPLVTLCGGGCRSENLRLSGDPDVPPCGPWRVRAIAELLAEECVDVVHWPLEHLLAAAHKRGIEAPERLDPVVPSRHLLDT